LGFSYDSAYPFKAAQYGKVFRVADFESYKALWLSRKRADLTNLPDQRTQICDCPVCQHTNTNFKRLMQNPYESQMWNGLHNLWTMIKHQEQITGLVKLSAADGWDRNLFPVDVARNIQVVQEAFDNLPIAERIIEDGLDVQGDAITECAELP
jgi:hypothetical protein